MPSVNTARAREKAKDRVHEVLRQELQGELNTINNNPTLPDMTAPPDAHIYQSPQLLDEMLDKNAQQVLMISDEGPREMVQDMSGSGTRALEQRAYPISCAIIFWAAVHDPVNYKGKQLEEIEIMQMRADRYAGALDEVVRKYAADGEAIMKVDMTDDTSVADATTGGVNSGGIIGFAGVRFSLTQLTSAPADQKFP